MSLNYYYYHSAVYRFSFALWNLLLCLTNLHGWRCVLFCYNLALLLSSDSGHSSHTTTQWRNNGATEGPDVNASRAVETSTWVRWREVRQTSWQHTSSSDNIRRNYRPRNSPEIWRHLQTSGRKFFQYLYLDYFDAFKQWCYDDDVHVW